MSAKVIKEFRAPLDGQVDPVAHKKGDIVHGRLALNAISEGFAVAEKSTVKKPAGNLILASKESSSETK